MISALHRLIAAALSVGLWPYLIDGLGHFTGYLNGNPSYEGPDDFWPVVWYFRFFGIISIIFAWIVIYIFKRANIKSPYVFGYIVVYFVFVAFIFSGERYSDSKTAISALYGGLLPLSAIALSDLIHALSAKILRNLRTNITILHRA